jgi:hypothetical protein
MTVRAVTHALVFVIERAHFVPLMAEYPADMNQLLLSAGGLPAPCQPLPALPAFASLASLRQPCQPCQPSPALPAFASLASLASLANPRSRGSPALWSPLSLCAT